MIPSCNSLPLGTNERHRNITSCGKTESTTAQSQMDWAQLKVPLHYASLQQHTCITCLSQQK